MKARIKTAQDERDELIKDVMGMSDADLRAWKRAVRMDDEGNVWFSDKEARK